MIKPFGTQILVQPTKKNQLLVSDQHSLCEYGDVIAVGDAVKDIKVGDKIGFLVWGLNSLDIDGTKHYFVTESDEFILGTIHE